MKTIRHEEAGRAVARLMPSIIRGISLDFFVRRRITQTQFLVLLAVHSYGRCPMGRLARSMQVRMPTATGVVGRLARDGFVRRLPCAEDRRQVLVGITPKGESFIRQFQEVVQRRWEEVLKILGPEELAAFYRVITKLREQLESPSPP